ncbi:DUF4062 domain-containing protein [Paenibacillus sp. BIC5C1]|uniref:DUF4062 domain-containing protein n=1 Tax=Paenibacillus sp. BIC5C1 TaxID=3078263 RepID=UPI0028EF9D51|nr:DUF4062 domain-containing protein [Paenibacillus sp. BIC5C1]
MDKRYQVFVSSTYRDLQEERKEIMQALLELDCIPSGMELFPATNDDQWTLIKSVIDDSDYYIVVLGGRYGSIGPKGISYTEMEYRYALESGKPIIAFVHENPDELPVNRTELEKEGREKLKEFRELTQEKLVRTWSTPSDLGSVVSRSLTKLIKSNPAVGWVRADSVSDGESAKEILRLKTVIDDLQTELKTVRTTPPIGVENLHQGNDKFDLGYTFPAKNNQNSGISRLRGTLEVSWDEIFYYIGPILLNESTEDEMARALIRLIIDEDGKKIRERGLVRNTTVSVDSTDFQTIKIQLRALRLIAMSSKQRSVKDTSTYWMLTPYGDDYLMSLRALRK